MSIILSKNGPAQKTSKNLTPTDAPALTSPSATACSVHWLPPAPTTCAPASLFLFYSTPLRHSFWHFLIFFPISFFVRKLTSRSTGRGAYQFHKNSRDLFCTGTVISFFLNWFAEESDFRLLSPYEQGRAYVSLTRILSLAPSRVVNQEISDWTSRSDYNFLVPASRYGVR